MPRGQANQKCTHSYLCYDVSRHAEEVGFERAPLEKRVAATTRSGNASKVLDLDGTKRQADQYTFPGPLVVPGDDLATDPGHPPQSLRSFTMLKTRNSIKKDRNCIYVVDVPTITHEVSFMGKWLQPRLPRGYASPGLSQDASPPGISDLSQYLSAFYHGFDIKSYNGSFRWLPWKDLSPEAEYVGLATNEDQCTRIRCRESPDKIAQRQLNLNDVLDALLEVVPQDAHAIVLLVDHDMYEDEDDDFCCGRAYGGSRISVVSSFRYHPLLDGYMGIEQDHMWPASHCQSYVNSLCGAKPTRSSKGSMAVDDDDESQPLAAAIKEAEDVLVPQSLKDISDMWFARVARTVTHELGHCFGMGHCVYYACVMQGTGGLSEDGRQPPYLCPVCLAKLSYAVVGEAARRDSKEKEAIYVAERYHALKVFCANWKSIGMFAGFYAWLNTKA